MKVHTAALAALLLLVICSLAEAHPQDSGVIALSQKPDISSITCCVKSMRIRIPRRLITSAYMTSSSCILPAVILVTKNGMKICADPKAPWVEAYLKHFETLKKAQQQSA